MSETNPLIYKEPPYYGRKAFHYYRGKSLINKEHIQEHPLLEKGTSYHISETNPLIYKETPYYGRKAFPYYRRRSLTNKENIQENLEENPLL